MTEHAQPPAQVVNGEEILVLTDSVVKPPDNREHKW